ncbi:MAG: chemotaxis protein CheW [Anaerolineae bacterium]|nr:chemotaxis protein CheW [Anaerolineae bacterium]
MTSQAVSAAIKTTKSSSTLALLFFKVDGQLYGLPVNNVARIIEMVTITPLPGIPDVMEGIINWHGKVVPVMDLRRRFNLPVCSYGLHTPIILVDLIGQDYFLGLVVDTVEDVREVSVDDLELAESIAPAELASQITTRAAYLAGVATVDRRFILVLNIHTLLNPVVQSQLTQALGLKVG